MRVLRTLRFRLALLGFAAVYLPVVILLGVVVVTDEREVVTVEDDEPAVVHTSSRAPSPWALATTAVLAPVAALASWALAGRAVRPLVRIRATADTIMATSLSQRIGQQAAPTEVAELAASFDRMLDRLDRAARAQTTFIEDASHELRTPLAILETNSDVLLAGLGTDGGAPDAGELRAGLERNRRAVARLGRAVDDLVRAARHEAARLELGPVDLAAVAVDAADQWREPLAAAGLALRVSVPAGGAAALADRPSVERLVDNLLDNAVRHARGATWADLTVAREGGEVVLTVSDDGPGIPPGQEQAAFLRRWTQGPAEATDRGSGLGLAIAAQVMAAHGGSLDLDRSHRPGARFVARFPASA